MLWMASNLVPAARATAAAGGQPRVAGKKPVIQPLVWAFDVKGAADLYEDYKRVDSWGLLCQPPRGITMNILRAEQSDRWTEGMIRTLADCAAKAELNAQKVGSPMVRMVVALCSRCPRVLPLLEGCGLTASRCCVGAGSEMQQLSRFVTERCHNIIGIHGLSVTDGFSCVTVSRHAAASMYKVAHPDVCTSEHDVYVSCTPAKLTPSVGARRIAPQTIPSWSSAGACRMGTEGARKSIYYPTRATGCT